MMNFKMVSLLAFALAVLGAYMLLENGYFFSGNPITITLQVLALALMIWARITFGLRSFHAAANTTKGELVTKGPYRWLRHPIYASLIYFAWACVIAFPFKDAMLAAMLVTLGLFIRMVLEEKFLMKTYPEYAAYKERAKRLIPFLI